MQAVGGEEAWGVSQLVIADDKALMGDSSEKLHKLMSESGRVCVKRKKRV